MSFPVRSHSALSGNTIRFTWVGSGLTPTQIYSALYDKNETLVNSITAISSGNGHYYAPVTMPTTYGWYVNQWHATVDSFPYVSRQLINVRKLETD